MAPRTLLWIVLAVLLFALALRAQALLSGGKNLELAREQGTYQALRNVILENYVEEVDEKALFYGAMQGMANALDRHSVFWPPEQFDAERASTSGHFGGLGIEITQDDRRGLLIVTPLADTPAFKAGLLPDDRIVKIAGQSTEKMSIEDASRLIRGPAGTKLLLSIQRDGASRHLDFEITRAVIKIESLQEARLLAPPEALAARVPEGAPRLGYVQIAQFQEETAKDLEKALRGFLAEGMRALVLDLRQNPGGLLRAAVDVCDLFLEDGAIVTTRSRPSREGAASEEAFQAKAEGTLPRFPIAILIDSRSASASEIVAGCLKDRGRALLVGEKSYGKGSVQTILPVNLSWGDAALKLTTARYFTPSGVCIDGKGIEADFPVPFGVEQMRALISARRKRRMEHNDPRSNGAALSVQPTVSEEPAAPAAAETRPPEPFRDTQLEKAIEVLMERLRTSAP